MRHADLGGGGDVYFQYDAAGTRVRKVVVNAAGTQTEERLYLGAVELYRERTGTTLNAERQTLHIADDTARIAIVETLTVDAGSTLSSPPNIARYQHANHLSTVSIELDDAANVISYEEFHPYGTSAYRAVDSTIAVSAKRYRYAGKERDHETGLDHMGARMYAPWLARWTSTDPIGLGDGVNRYAYVSGNPVAMSDPSGTKGERLADLQAEVSAAAEAVANSSSGPLQDEALADLYAGTTALAELSAQIAGTLHDNAVDIDEPTFDSNFNEDINSNTEPAAPFPKSGTGEGTGRAHNTDDYSTVLPVPEDPYASARDVARHPEALIPVVGPALDSARSFNSISGQNSWDENVAFAGLGVANAAFAVIDFATFGTASPATNAARLLVRAEARNVGRAAATRTASPRVSPRAAGGGRHPDALPESAESYQLELFPTERYNRTKHYGNTPTAEQRRSVPEGMEFDHDPMLVEHYWEGPGGGRLPGYNLTPAERKAFGADVGHGKPGTPAEQRRQGAAAAAYSKRKNKQHGL